MRFFSGILGGFLWLCTVGRAEAVPASVLEEVQPDPFLEIAETHAVQAVARAEDPEQRARHLLELARIRMRLGYVDAAEQSLEEVPRRLPEDLKQEAYLLWADLHLQREQWDLAAEKLSQVDVSSATLNEAHRLLKARLAYATEGLEAALSVLELNEEPLSAEVLFQAAAFHLLSGQQEEAKGWLQKSVDASPASAASNEARIQLARLYSLEGQTDQALALIKPLTEEGTFSSLLELELYPVLIGILEENGSFTEAADFIAAFTERIENPDLRVILHGKEAHHRIQAGELEAMDQRLGEWIARYGDDASLAVAQLSLARAWADREQFEKARTAYERFISVFTAPDLLLEAMAALAEIQMELGEYSAASDTAQRARDRMAPEHPFLPAMIFLQADAAFRLNEVGKATSLFEQWLTQYPDDPQMPSVGLRASEAFARSDRMEEAMNVLANIRTRYPDSPEAETAMFQQALLLGPKRVEQALGAFDAYLEAYPEGLYVADAMTEKGIAAYRLGLFDLAVREFKEVERRFPQHPRVEQAVCLTGWATYLKGDDEAARALGEAFLTRYPSSEFEPDVRIWLAEMAYNRGDYSTAAKEFQVLSAERYPRHLRARASYLAGRSLLANQKGVEALTWLELSLQISPESPFAPEVLFYLGDALTELDRFDEAIVRFQEVVREYPKSYLVSAAQGRIGDCQYTLGEENPERYQEALHTYRQLMEASRTPEEIRFQATYKTGRALSALGRKEEAQELFLMAIARFNALRRDLPSSSTIWFVRSVTDAAQYYEFLGRYRDAIRIYRELAGTNLEEAAEAQRRIEDLRREHLILF